MRGDKLTLVGQTLSPNATLADCNVYDGCTLLFERGEGYELAVFERSFGRPTFRKGPLTPARRTMIQGYCKDRFGRELDDEDIEIIAELLVGADPPIENRKDQRFKDAFSIIEGAKSVRTSLREQRLSQIAEEQRTSQGGISQGEAGDVQRSTSSPIATDVTCPLGSTGFHIFLSYRRIDVDKARSVKQALVALGYVVFMDITSEGLEAGDFQLQLERHLKSTPVVVALFAATLNADGTEEFLRIKNPGDFVRLELRATLHMKKLLIPLWTSASPGTPRFDISRLIWQAGLPADVVDIGKQNMVELSTNFFDASIAKVHGMITARASCGELGSLTSYDGELPGEPD